MSFKKINHQKDNLETKSRHHPINSGAELCQVDWPLQRRVGHNELPNTDGSP